MADPTSASRTHEDRLETAFAAALKQHEQELGEPLPNPPTLEMEATEEFSARVVPIGDGTVVRISTGTVDHLDALWSRGLDDPKLLAEGDIPEGYAADELTDVSLAWLVLHELMHVKLGHVALAGAAGLSDPVTEEGLDILSFAKQTDLAFPTLPADERKKVRPCLEMQADNDATDLLFGVYADDAHQALRLKCASIVAVMALIEVQTVKAGQSVHYPLAGTRFFQTLGHLYQMWMFPLAAFDEDGETRVMRIERQVDEAEYDAFIAEVLVPVVSDATILARASGADAFADVLGGEMNLLRDLLTVQLAEDMDTAELLTEAAKEWCELVKTNGMVLGVIRNGQHTP
ncbi:MAG: hypothetical protein ROR55_03030 [Devosia sp.]